MGNTPMLSSLLMAIAGLLMVVSGSSKRFLEWRPRKRSRRRWRFR